MQTVTCAFRQYNATKLVCACVYYHHFPQLIRSLFCIDTYHTQPLG